MKYCTNCGAEINDENAKFCANCGCEMQSHIVGSQQMGEQPSPKAKLSQKKTIIISSIVAAFVLVLLGITLFILPNSFSNSSEPTLSHAIELIGTPCEDILSNTSFSIENILGITVAKSKTEDVFGIAGGYVIFVLEDEEYIDIVTWQSDDNIRLTEQEIKSFLNEMINVYGKPINSSDDSEDSYLWHNDEHSIMLNTENREIYIVISIGE